MLSLHKRDIIYMDYNATAPLEGPARHALSELDDLTPYNPSSVHALGRHAKGLLEAARRKLLEAVGVKSHGEFELVFTGSCTESNNIALSGRNYDNVFVSTIEHKSVLDNVQYAMIKVDPNGVIRLDLLEQLLANTKGSTLISIMLANNETGVIQPIQEVSRIAKLYGAFVHTDAAQGFGKIKVDIAQLGVDILTISSHKIGGPHGAGAIVYRKNLDIGCIMHGGGQEYRVRPGTHNLPAIHAFAAAASAVEERIQKYMYVEELRDYIEKKVLSYGEGIFIASGQAPLRLPNTISILTPGIQADEQVMYFDLNNIALSAGSACSSGRVELPYVHMSMGYLKEIASCAIRVSLGPDSSKKDADKFVDVWRNMLKSKK